jgi:hypothetical protein
MVKRRRTLAAAWKRRRPLARCRGYRQLVRVRVQVNVTLREVAEEEEEEEGPRGHSSTG